MADPQSGDRAGGDVRPPGNVAEDADAAEPAEDLRQRDPGLDPGQLRAQAGVDPEPDHPGDDRGRQRVGDAVEEVVVPAGPAPPSRTRSPRPAAGRSARAPAA